MSNFENGMNSQYNFLNKSNYIPLNYNNNSSSFLKLPVLNYSQQTKMIGDELDRRNQIKEETLFQKQKIFQNRGLPEHYPHNR